MKLRARLMGALSVAIALPSGVAIVIAAASPTRALIAFAVTIVVGGVVTVLLADNLTRPITEELTKSESDVRDSVRRLGEALRSTHDLTRILAVVLETALVAVKGRSGAVFMLSANRQELYVKVGRHLPENAADRRLGIGEGLAGFSVRERQAVLLPSDVEVVPADPEPVAETALAVPLETQSQVLGAIVVYGRDGVGPFTNADLDTIASLARQAGVGVENVLLHQEAQRQAITDGLTGVWTQRYFQLQLAHDFERAVRFSHNLSLLFLDIDHFKQINDRYGHQRGNAILVELAQRVHSHVRMNIDTLARFGGEEFTLILPETPLSGALRVAEKIRNEVASRPFGEQGEDPIPVTVSIGYAAYPEHGMTPSVLLNQADKAMYRAKHDGRNRVVGADALGEDGNLATIERRP